MSYPKATILDVETTGLSNSDRAIEIALVQFSFDPTSFKIRSVDKAYLGLSDPGFPIPYHARNVHGITDSVVAGKSFDYRKINQIISDSDYLIAHNASFDRKMLSRDSEIKLPAQDRWRCSCYNIDWKRRHHFPNKRLDTIRSMLSISNKNSHQAMADVEVVLEVLMRPAILAELMGMIVEGDINHAVPPAITITLPDRENILPETSKTRPAHTDSVQPATVTSASNQLRGFLTSYKSGNAKKQALDDLASKLNAFPWGTQWHPVYDYDSRLTELVKLVGPADVSAGIINGNFTLLIRQAGLDRRRSEYNRPDKIKKAVTDLRGYLRKQTGNADFHRKKAFLDFLALNLGLDWDSDWNAIDDFESRLQLFVELKGIRSVEEGIYTKKFEEIYKRYRSKPVQSNSSGKAQKEKDSPVGCMLLIGLLIMIAFAISR